MYLSFQKLIVGLLFFLGAYCLLFFYPDLKNYSLIAIFSVVVILVPFESWKNGKSQPLVVFGIYVFAGLVFKGGFNDLIRSAVGFTDGDQVYWLWRVLISIGAYVVCLVYTVVLIVISNPLPESKQPVDNPA